MSIKVPWEDGERIPLESVEEIFCPPPNIPLTFHRSSLIVGSKGAGKTIFLLYQQATHKGVALSISLPEEFSSLPKQTGIGPYAFDCPAAIERGIIGKATSLLALGITSCLMNKDIAIPFDLLQDCIPTDLQSGTTGLNRRWVSDTRRLVASAPPSEFERVAHEHPLLHLVSEMGKASERSYGSLLLLLDRADLVASPALVPVFELLDQSGHHVALVATRPGLTGRSVQQLTERLVAGDVYNLVCLGTDPRSDSWIQFVENAVEAQIGTAFKSIPENIKDWIELLARDSVRVALELSYRYLTTSKRSAMEGLVEAVEDQRENLLAAAQGTLQKYHPDFRKTISNIRNEAIKQHGNIPIPLNVNIEPRAVDELFSSYSELGRFLDIALRISALCLPEGYRWAPGTRTTSVEIPPLLLWQREDPMWTFDSLKQTDFNLKEKDMLRPSRGRVKGPSIFVAYRMNFEDSKQFRRDLEDMIRAYPGLKDIIISDGHVLEGTPWAEAIRDRIRRAKLVIGDVQGLRSDVIFELGFAYGLGKVIIPVVSDEAERTNIPKWLQATQFGRYGDTVGLESLVASIEMYLMDPSLSKLARATNPSPGLAIWIRELNWNVQGMKQFETAAKREGFHVEIFSDVSHDEILIRKASSASLLFVSLDGTEDDTLIHFIVGAVIAKPRAGAGRTLPRVVRILELPTKPETNFTAESLARCQDIALKISPDEVWEETQRFANIYHQWLGSSSHRRGRRH